MAIAELTTQRNTQGGPASTAATYTFPVAPANGNLVVFCMSWRGNTSINSVPFSCSLATPTGSASANIDGAIYYKVADGTEGITWTFGLAASFKNSGCATEFTGALSASGPLDKTTLNDGTGTAATCGTLATLSQADELVVACYGCNTNATFSAHDNSQTQIMTSTSTGGSGATRNTTSFATRIVIANTAVNYGATVSASRDWTTGAATFKAFPEALAQTPRTWGYIL